MTTFTGPPYPPAPSAGQNALGQFAIGVGPLGDIVPFSYWQTVISKYANSTIITTLIGNFSVYLDQTENMSNLYDTIWNDSTAQGYGLDVWGRIVGVTRNLQISGVSWFGFDEALPGSEPFGQGAFFSGSTLTNAFALSDDTFRTLIYAKAMANISNGSIPSINSILMALFPGRGNCYVTDGAQNGSWFGFEESTTAQPFGQAAFYDGESIQSMVMSYVFSFPLQPYELAIVEQSGVLPKPCGVAASVVLI